MTYENRVLAVLDGSRLKNQSQVIREARMGTERCLETLAALRETGLVQRFTAQVMGRGRPAYLYRKVA